MAIYKRVFVSSISEFSVLYKAFLSENGWTLTEQGTSSGVAWTKATKGSVAHNVYFAENGSFANKSGSNRLYKSTAGLSFDEFTAYSCSPLGELPFPLTVDFFETSDKSLLICAEIRINVWTQTYSGFLDKTICGSCYGDKICSGGAGVQISSGKTMSIEELIYHGSYNGFLSCELYCYYYYNNSSSQKPDNGEMTESTVVNMDGKFVCSAWISSYYFYFKETVRFFTENNVSYNLCAPRGYIYEPYHAIVAYNSITGLPFLMPCIFYVKLKGEETKRRPIGTLSDIFFISTSRLRAGEEFSLGKYKFRMYPLGNGTSVSPKETNQTGVSFAVRSN